MRKLVVRALQTHFKTHTKSSRCDMRELIVIVRTNKAFRCSQVTDVPDEIKTNILVVSQLVFISYPSSLYLHNPAYSKQFLPTILTFDCPTLHLDVLFRPPYPTTPCPASPRQSSFVRPYDSSGHTVEVLVILIPGLGLISDCAKRVFLLKT